MKVKLLTLILAVVTSTIAKQTQTVKATAVLHQESTPCVHGVPASLPSEGSWLINYASVTPDPATSDNYMVNSTWASAHYIHRAVSMSSLRDSLAF